MSKDISRIIEGWDYKPGQISARKIKGDDGKEKIQMRVDLGVLQLETEGRPDGKMPHNKESFFEYYLSQLEEHKAKKKTAKSFTLNDEACEELYREALQYYQRYLSLFSLKEYPGAIRDTERNLKVHSFVIDYAISEKYKALFIEAVPYIIMMNTKAKALLKQDEKHYDEALREIKRGTEKIAEFFRNYSRAEMIEKSEEIKSLREMAKKIQKTSPLTGLKRLKIELAEAVRKEDFEKAARLRDKIREIEGEE
ncbi:MAG: UvrB/UvrC motif-containing protein [Candidatus Aerophobetes bacterium]|nr:UvrB/UvrC motif-containing protein [Candidatus Aerophobetes bacterium]